MATNEKQKQNLAIWDQVSETDPNKTKEFKKQGGFSGTSINPTYLMQKATKIWGPCGTGWGYEILEDRFDLGAPIIDKETKVPTGAFYQAHTLKIRFWYEDGAGKHHIDHYGHTPFVYSNSYGVQTDFEAPKKSLTDALKKCLSMLGFSADIMLGDFEDSDYKQQVTEKVRVEKAEDEITEMEQIRAEHKEWLERHIKTMKAAPQLHELETVYRIVMKTLKSRNDEDGMKMATKTKDARKKELEKQGKTTETAA